MLLHNSHIGYHAMWRESCAAAKNISKQPCNTPHPAGSHHITQPTNACSRMRGNIVIREGATRSFTSGGTRTWRGTKFKDKLCRR